jgi:phage baseplate assembly protein W
MSFDIKVLNGDIEFDGSGNLRTMRNSDKLAQDVIKVLNTPIGTSSLNLGYGSSLTANDIGTAVDVDRVIQQTQASIAQALEQIISLQALQQAVQPLTDAETIVDFETPIVEQDSQDPRQFNIAVNALSRDLTPLTVALVVRF